MSNDERIEIALSQGKLRAMAAACLGFIALSIGLLSVDEPLGFLPESMDSALVANIVGGVGLAFFGLCAVFAVRKLFDRRPGLVIDRNGIEDNSSAIAAGRIPWTHILGFEEYVIQGQAMVVVKVRDVESYIARGNAMAQAIRRANFKLCGSPVTLAASGLQVEHADLLRILGESAQRFGLIPRN